MCERSLTSDFGDKVIVHVARCRMYLSYSAAEKRPSSVSCFAYCVAISANLKRKGYRVKRRAILRVRKEMPFDRARLRMYSRNKRKASQKSAANILVLSFRLIHGLIFLSTETSYDDAMMKPLLLDMRIGRSGAACFCT